MGKWFDRLRDQDAPISKWRILDTVTLHGHPNGLSVHSSFMDAMGIPWTLHGLSMDSPWNLHGICMDSPWTLHGLSMDSPWTLHGLSMDSPLALHGLSMDSP